jgi:hypothetical protein
MGGLALVLLILKNTQCNTTVILSVRNCHYSLHNYPEERIYLLNFEKIMDDFVEENARKI